MLCVKAGWGHLLTSTGDTWYVAVEGSPKDSDEDSIVGIPSAKVVRARLDADGRPERRSTFYEIFGKEVLPD